jgi:hypothetical protein
MKPETCCDGNAPDRKDTRQGHRDQEQAAVAQDPVEWPHHRPEQEFLGDLRALVCRGGKLVGRRSGTSVRSPTRTPKPAI